jgi:hypothetical protein
MQYYLWVTDSGGVRIQQWYTASEAGCASGTGICSIVLTPTLIPGTSHWWVQPWNSSVGHGPWGSGKSFSF